MTHTYTKKELATIAGYTYRRLYDIDMSLTDDEKLFVKSEDGKYRLDLFIQRWVKYNVGREEDKAGGKSLEEVKAIHEAVKTEKTQLEVARLRGQLIDMQDIKRLWGDIANTVRQNMIHLPSKLAPMLRMMDNTEVIADIIGAEIRKALEEIADTPLPTYAAETSEEESEEESDEEV